LSEASTEGTRGGGKIKCSPLLWRRLLFAGMHCSATANANFSSLLSAAPKAHFPLLCFEAHGAGATVGRRRVKIHRDLNPVLPDKVDRPLGDELLCRCPAWRRGRVSRRNEFSLSAPSLSRMYGPFSGDDVVFSEDCETRTRNVMAGRRSSVDTHDGHELLRGANGDSGDQPLYAGCFMSDPRRGRSKCLRVEDEWGMILGC